MDTLHILEEKIRLLVGHIKKLQDEQEQLTAEHTLLKKQYTETVDELSAAVQENKKLHNKVKELQKASVDEGKELKALNHEREQALLAVDNLIKSIDGLIASEAVQ